jgi:hypothetical protein
MDSYITAQLSQKAKKHKTIAQEDESEEEEGTSGSEDEEEEAQQRDWLLRFLSKTFHGTRHCPVEEGGTTLLLALEHPAQAIYACTNTHIHI